MATKLPSLLITYCLTACDCGTGFVFPNSFRSAVIMGFISFFTLHHQIDDAGIFAIFAKF
jgi:hypothetical protein